MGFQTWFLYFFVAVASVLVAQNLLRPLIYIYIVYVIKALDQKMYMACLSFMLFNVLKNYKATE